MCSVPASKASADLHICIRAHTHTRTPTLGLLINNWIPVTYVAIEKRENTNMRPKVAHLQDSELTFCPMFPNTQRSRIKRMEQSDGVLLMYRM